VDLAPSWLRVMKKQILQNKTQMSVIYSGANSWWYRTSCHRVICGALIQICSFPTSCPPRRGALDMCGTARIFRLEHNICMKSTSTMLNPGRSAASAQHPLLPPCRRTPSSRVIKKNPRSLELLTFKKSKMVVTYIQILVYYSTFIQTKLHNSRASAINLSY